MESFPNDFNYLLDKIFLFKIKVTEFNLKQDYSAYTVVKLTEDQDILMKFKMLHEDSQVYLLNLFALHQHNVCGFPLRNRNYVLKLMQDSVEQIREHAAQNFSTPTNLKTPIDIEAEKSDLEQTCHAQLSTTKAVKRIKIEKLDNVRVPNDV